jgi:hypothetical protein
MTSHSLTLDLIPLPADFDGDSEVSCPACCDELEIHQPDEQQPGRLLGVCHSCSAWFMIDSAAAVMVLLPDENGLREAYTELVRSDRPRVINVGDLERMPSRPRWFRDGRV